MAGQRLKLKRQTITLVSFLPSPSPTPTLTQVQVQVLRWLVSLPAAASPSRQLKAKEEGRQGKSEPATCFRRKVMREN